MKCPSQSRRRKAVLLTSAAAGAASTLAPAIMAAPIIVNPAVPPTASVTGSGATGAFIDLNNDGRDDFAIALYRSTGSGTTKGAAIIGGLPRGTSSKAGNNLLQTTGSISALRATKGPSFQVGTSLSGNSAGVLRVASRYSAGPVQVLYGLWPGGAAFGDTKGYVAVEFAANDGLHYGWIRLSVRNDANGIPNGVQAISWAYESDPGVPLHVTSLAVPEVPVNAAGLGALALGAAGIQAFRRKRARARP